MAKRREAMGEIDEEVVPFAQSRLPGARFSVASPGGLRATERIWLGLNIAHPNRVQIGFGNPSKSLQIYIRLMMDDLDLMPLCQGFGQNGDADLRPADPAAGRLVIDAYSQ